MMQGLSGAQSERRTVMIEATSLNAHRTASSLRVKRGPWATDRTHKGGMNTKLHTVTDAHGRPISLFMTASQVSDHTGAAALLDSRPKAQWLLGERGYDADWFRDALQAKGITPFIPGRKTRIEIMFGRLKDWRRVAARYDRCPNVFLSAIVLAATVLFWLCVLSPDQGASEGLAKQSAGDTWPRPGIQDGCSSPSITSTSARAEAGRASMNARRSEFQLKFRGLSRK